MSKIRIQNFGPIKQGCIDNDGWIDIEKVTVFIGNQGSGKSTVAKVISTMMWLEKAINRGDMDAQMDAEIFIEFFDYQRVHNYFRDATVIEYQGDILKIEYKNSIVKTEVTINQNGNYRVPKIMYVPAERNFLSVIENPYSISNLPSTLKTFAEELLKGLRLISNQSIALPIGEGLSFLYTKENNKSYLIGKDYELDLTEASSGYQSFIPLYLVSKFLTEELSEREKALLGQLSVEQSVRRKKEIADVMFNNLLSEEEKGKKVKAIDSKYINTCFINIVEEPEQNLFPTSQQKMLNTLLATNRKEDNKLIMTTHSPYLINYLTLSVKAASLIEKITQTKGNSNLIPLVEMIVPENSVVKGEDLVVYELDNDGNIKELGNYKGMPSDDNYLNKEMAEVNYLFDDLLQLEKRCQ